LGKSTKLQTPNSKLQNPSSKEAPGLKHQITGDRAEIGLRIHAGRFGMWCPGFCTHHRKQPGSGAGIRSAELFQKHAQFWRDPSQLRPVDFRQRCEYPFAVRGQSDVDLPPVQLRHCSRNQRLHHQPVHQSHGTVMLHLEALRQFTDGHLFAAGEPFDGQQRLMLLGCDPGLMRRILAEPQELPQREAKGGKLFILHLGEDRGFFHESLSKHRGAREAMECLTYIVIRYKEQVMSPPGTFPLSGPGHSRPGGFDGIAPFYRAMEAFCAGRKLQRCRTAFLGEIPVPRSILLAGEGHGRSLEACLRQFPRATIIAVDASARMLEAARARLSRAKLDISRVQFIQADLLEWEPPREAFDLIVTHFFLDCFTEGQLAKVVSRLAHGAAPGAQWLVADFQIAASGLARWRSRSILAMLYAFFRIFTRLPASSLAPPEPALEKAGFRRYRREESEWHLLKSEWWRREEV
jgi:ubiquinone/menaquinone biosynthesis C-methylase UbiE